MANFDRRSFMKASMATAALGVAAALATAATGAVTAFGAGAA